MRPPFPRRRTLAHAAIASGIFLGAFLFRFLSTTGFHNDQYMHMAWAAQVIAGELPVRDFVDPGMPLTYLTSAVAWLLVGRPVLAEALLCVTFLAFAAALTFHLASKASGSMAVGTLAAISQMILVARLYSYPKLVLYLWAVWAFWRYADRPARSNLLWVVACTATAFLFRHDHGLIIGLAAAVLLLATHWKGERWARWRPILAYAIGLFLALAPYLAYLQVSGGAASYVMSGLRFNQAEREPRVLREWPRFDVSPQRIDPPVVSVRWAAGIDEPARARLEAKFGLRAPRHVAGPTWRYFLEDATETNIKALLAQPDVEDTAGIDRVHGRIDLRDDTVLTWLARFASRRGWTLLAGVARRDNAVAWLYYVFVTLPAVTLGVLALRHLRGWRLAPGEPGGTSGLAGSAALCAAANYGFLRDPLDVRLADASAVTFVLAAWLVGQAWHQGRVAVLTGEPRRSSPHLRRMLRPVVLATLVAVVGAVTVVSAADVGHVVHVLARTGLTEGLRPAVDRGVRLVNELGAEPAIDGWLAIGDERAELKRLTQYASACTQPSDHLLVTWFAPEVSFYAGRRFAAGLAFFYPGFFSSPEDQQRALSRLQAQSVPIALVEVGAYERFFRREYPAIAEYLNRHYDVAAEVPAVDGQVFRVLTDRRASPIRTWEPWSLPCFH